MTARINAAASMLFFRYRSDEDELAADRLLQFIHDVTAGLAVGSDGHWRVDLPPDHEPFEFVVRDANGAVLVASSPPAEARVADGLDDAGSGTRGQGAGPLKQTLTGAFAHIETAAGPVVIEVAEAETANSEEVRRAGQESLEDVLPILVPFILAALIIGVYTIRKSLAPLAAVARQAAAITPSETHHRLTQGGLPRELEPLVAAVNGALDRLDEGFRRQREFTADAAHELRTPLAILAAHLENLGDGGTAATLREDVARMSLALVLLEPVRSAEPPTSSGSTGASASITLREDCRVASLGASADTLFLTALMARSAAATRSPSMRRSNSARWACAACRFCQLSKLGLPRWPMARQAARIGSGTTNGG